MNNVIIRPKSREEWLEHRKNGIGSSEVATIVGLNPWETPYQLWRRKLGLDPAKDETFAMKAGTLSRRCRSHVWHDETGREIIKRSAGDWIIANKERPYLQVSPTAPIGFRYDKEQLQQGYIGMQDHADED